MTEVTPKPRVLSDDELSQLYDLGGAACTSCGRSDDWIVEQEPSGRVIATCNDCDGCTTVVPMAVVERLLRPARRPYFA